MTSREHLELEYQLAQAKTKRDRALEKSEKYAQIVKNFKERLNEYSDDST